MLLSFNIEYRTNWGEDVRVSGSIPELGSELTTDALPLHTVDGIHWNAEVEIRIPAGNKVNYSYHIFANGKPVRTEWNDIERTLYTDTDNHTCYLLQDCWKDLPEQQYFYTSAFTESLLARPNREASMPARPGSIVIKAYAPCMDADCCLGICGNQPVLGNWNPDKAILMSDADFPEWQVVLDVATLKFPVEYKFILYNKRERHAMAWEENPNRYLPYPHLRPGQALVIGDRYVHFNLPAWKGAGVAIPVFSLRSEGSCGIGDFGDLKRMVDWAVLTHQKIVQILPINDTTMTHAWTDSYPYSSISIYALHPLYADLRQMGTLDDEPFMEEFRKQQQTINAATFMDYEAVSRCKWDYFVRLFRQEGEKVLASDDYQQFYRNNEEWLKPYAVFCYLRDTYRTPDFRQWPRHNTYDADEIDKLCMPGSADYPHIALHCFLQYHLHRQLLAVTNHARRNGIVLKGDIPIGIDRNSVEAWREPHYFNMNGQAGAPPDDFSVNGQNWGFPTYNWEVMAQDGYSWWMKRFRKMSEYFDAYRIDHILGFFRIWEIPMHSVHGLLGQFSPSLPMSREEIEGFGLTFQEEKFLLPYIHEHFLNELFGPHTDYVKQHFIEPSGIDGEYRLRSGYDTQRKIEAYFAGKGDEASCWIRDGLYTLISDVLFVRDRHIPDKYHPRISAQHDYLYRTLDKAGQEAFDRLYEHYYYHRHNEFWRQQAMEKLPCLIQSTRMLVCGEDLGMIPDCVPWVMHDLRILSLEIQRMPKAFAQEFGIPAQYPYRSVSTISTHDMSTLRGWWEENPQQTQYYFNSVLQHYGAAPASATPEVCEEVIRQHLAGSSMFCILSLQDWMSMDGKWRNPRVNDERINIPSNPHHYWRYRMHLTLEQLMQAESLNSKIRTMIDQIR